MSGGELRTSLMLTVEQIIDGDAVCAGCSSPAALVVMTGADPEPVPVCGEHSIQYLALTQGVVARIFAPHAS